MGNADPREFRQEQADGPQRRAESGKAPPESGGPRGSTLMGVGRSLPRRCGTALAARERGPNPIGGQRFFLANGLGFLAPFFEPPNFFANGLGFLAFGTLDLLE